MYYEVYSAAEKPKVAFGDDFSYMGEQKFLLDHRIL